MSKSPFFSIITPTYNRAQYLGEMIESVQAQTFEDYEHIIVDDGSTDNSAELLQKAEESDNRIKVITQENRGRSAARNVGLDIAQGKYICFLDSDDFWRDYHLNLLHQEISKAPRKFLFHTGLEWYYQDSDNYRKVDFESPEKYYSAVEYAIWYHTLVGLSIKIIPVYTAVIRIHTGNTSGLNDELKVIEEQIRVFESLLKDPTLRPLITSEFEHRRRMGLEHRRWKVISSIGTTRQLLKSTVMFCAKYPRNPSVLSKLVFAAKRMFSNHNNT
jgi:hypothetical protein